LRACRPLSPSASPRGPEPSASSSTPTPAPGCARARGCRTRRPSPTSWATPARTRRPSSPGCCTTSSRTRRGRSTTSATRSASELCALVAALTEDDDIERYTQRKHALRKQIEAAGSPVVDIAVADKIATLRHAVVTGTKISKRKLTHYRAVLELGEAAGAPERLSDELAELLAEIARR
jgi:hypothetical protein